MRSKCWLSFPKYWIGFPECTQFFKGLMHTEHRHVQTAPLELPPDRAGLSPPEGSESAAHLGSSVQRPVSLRVRCSSGHRDPGQGVPQSQQPNSFSGRKLQFCLFNHTKEAIRKSRRSEGGFWCALRVAENWLLCPLFRDTPKSFRNEMNSFLES